MDVISTRFNNDFYQMMDVFMQRQRRSKESEVSITVLYPNVVKPQSSNLKNKDGKLEKICFGHDCIQHKAHARDSKLHSVTYLKYGVGKVYGKFSMLHLAKLEQYTYNSIQLQMQMLQ